MCSMAAFQSLKALVSTSSIATIQTIIDFGFCMVIMHFIMKIHYGGNQNTKIRNDFSL